MATTTALSLADHTTSHGELSETVQRDGRSSRPVKPAASSSTRAGPGFQQALHAVADECGDGSVRERQPAQAVVDGVGNHDVVAGLRCHVLRQQDKALRLVELGGGLDGVDVGAGAVGVALVPEP